jgi:hypothetical protein
MITPERQTSGSPPLRRRGFRLDGDLRGLQNTGDFRMALAELSDVARDVGGGPGDRQLAVKRGEVAAQILADLAAVAAGFIPNTFNGPAERFAVGLGALSDRLNDQPVKRDVFDISRQAVADDTGSLPSAGVR